jgi:hypothetical protein
MKHRAGGCARRSLVRAGTPQGGKGPGFQSLFTDENNVFHLSLAMSFVVKAEQAAYVSATFA